MRAKRAGEGRPNGRGRTRKSSISRVEPEAQAQTIVSRDVLAAAWNAVRGLYPEGEREDDDALMGPVQDVVDRHGQVELARGLLKLLGELGRGLDAVNDPDDLERDALSAALPPIMRELRRQLPGVKPSLLPMLTGTLTAALLDEDVVAWRENVGLPDNVEAVILTVLVWLVATLLDDITAPGAAKQVAESLIAAAIKEM